MSIWTQMFLSNIIIWFFTILFIKMAGIDINKIIYAKRFKGWSLIIWTLLTGLSIPVWLIYLVIS